MTKVKVPKVKFLLPFVAHEVASTLLIYIPETEHHLPDRKRRIGFKAVMSCRTETINSQPQVVTSFTTSSASADWSSSVCDCCDNCGICLCGAFIPCILGCKVAQDHGESCCLPFLPGAMVALRTSMRNKYHISGSVCDDWVMMSCLAPCGLCQMAREQKMRG